MVSYVDAVVSVMHVLVFVLHVCMLRECEGAVRVVHIVQVLCLAQLTCYGCVWCVG